MTLYRNVITNQLKEFATIQHHPWVQVKSTLDSSFEESTSSNFLSEYTSPINVSSFDTPSSGFDSTPADTFSGGGGDFGGGGSSDSF